MLIGFLVALGMAAAPAKAQQENTPATAGVSAAEALETKPPIIPTEAFADRSIFGGARLSPNGETIALRATVDGETNILTLRASDKEPMRRVVATKDDNELEWFRWAGNEKILISVSSMGK